MTRVRVPLRAYTGCISTGTGSGSCSSSPTDFLSLTDTTDSYAGFAGKAVKVNATEDGLDFGDIVAAGLDSAIVSTTGGIITLDMNNQSERMFRGSANIGAIKTWALSNNTPSIFIPSVKFTMTTTDDQTFPSTFKMVSFDANWNDATKKWSPPAMGTYEMSATFDGTNWLMKIQGPY